MMFAYDYSHNYLLFFYLISPVAEIINT